MLWKKYYKYIGRNRVGHSIENLQGITNQTYMCVLFVKKVIIIMIIIVVIAVSHITISSGYIIFVVEVSYVHVLSNVATCIVGAIRTMKPLV